MVFFLDETLDYLTLDVFDTLDGVMRKSAASSGLSRRREDTAIVGYSLGGLMSCYAAMTRPQVL